LIQAIAKQYLGNKIPSTEKSGGVYVYLSVDGGGIRGIIPARMGRPAKEISGKT
jgi:hypothetical protein